MQIYNGFTTEEFLSDVHVRKKREKPKTLKIE